MNKKIKLVIFKFVLISIFGTLLFSCENETDIRDAEYPDQLIYMPAAYPDGQFTIDDITRKRGEQPIDGFLYRYVVDNEARKFHIPLSVYRAGVNNNGSFNINIEVDNDTISALNDTGDLSDTLHIIPKDKYSIVNSVEMLNGEEVAQFDLIVDLDFLMDNYPDKVFALAIGISSSQIKINPELGTTIVIIHTKIMKPTAVFSTSSDGRKIFFDNNSLMAKGYIWDFGDGYFSDEQSPSHEYISPGEYTVTLNAVGITGNNDKSVSSLEITIN